MADVALAGSLAAVSGFADVVCLVRFGAFAALQTGNIVHIGTSLALYDGRLSELMRALSFSTAVLASHFAAVFAFCMLCDHHSRPVLVAAPLVGLLSLLGGLADGLADGWKWGACFVAASFGAMNFLTSPNTVLDGRLATMVTLATGNLQKCAKMLYTAYAHGLSEQEGQATRVAGAVVLGTLIGATAGGVALAYASTLIAFMFIPVGICQCLLLGIHDRLLRPIQNSTLTEPLRLTRDNDSHVSVMLDGP